MFLVRPEAIQGESLSSWRQRSGLQNGFRLFPLASKELRRIDPDLSPSDDVVRWLEQQFEKPQSVISSMSLRSFDPRLVKVRPHGAPGRWIIPLRYTKPAVPIGSPFCPACLASDNEPFFRLKWRLALNSVCEVHAQLLNEKCAACSAAPWPAQTTRVGMYSKGWLPVHQCGACGADLRLQVRGRIIQPSPLLQSLITDSVIQLTPSLTASSRDVATGIWVACQLFSRTRPSASIIAADTEHSQVARLVQGVSRRGPEVLPIAMRHELVSAAAGLFEDWPGRFVEFCRAHKISAEHFSSDRACTPEWMASTINDELKLRARGISAADVHASICRLSAKNLAVNRTTVARDLNCWNALEVQRALGKRYESTLEEFLTVISRLRAELHWSSRRKSTSAMQVRDVHLICVCMAVGTSLREGIKLTSKQIEMNLDRWHNASNSERPRPELLDLIVTVRSLRGLFPRWLGGEDAVDAALVPAFRGCHASPRRAQVMLRRCMNETDKRLIRCASAFKVAALSFTSA